jgi:PAS domain S-box-containing protein
MQPRILLVEDQQIVAEDIRRRLSGFGFDVPAIASSGQEALEQAAELHPDILVTDIVLQGTMDGIEAAREIRKRFDIPVVYLTAYTDEPTVQRARSTDPTGYLIKPFDERELRFAIEIALQKHAMEKDLIERETRVRQVADTPGEILWLMDKASGSFLYVSPSYETLWGRPVKELQERSEIWTESVEQEDRHLVQEMLQRARKGELDERPTEYRIVRPDGTVRWIATRVFPVRAEDGSVYRVAGSSLDITQQKWAWETLRESEARYRLLAEHSTDIIARHSAEGIYLYASPASRTVLGYRPEELLGTSAYSHIHPDDLENIRRRDFEAGHFLAAGSETYRIRKKDGSHVWCESTSRTIRDPESGEVQEIIVVTRDISDRRWAEEAVGRYEFIVNASSEFMALINSEYVYEAANTAYCNAHGRPRSEIVGKTVAEIWGQETFRTVIKGYLDECFAGKAVQYEAWFEFGTLGRRFYTVHYSPSTNTDGTVTHCVVVSHDITARKANEDRLHASLQEKDLLLKEIHHRVKNNLQIISSLLSLQSNTIESPETRELVRESQNRVRSMALIHEKLYRSENFAQIDFGEYLRNLTRDLFRSYSAGGVTLKLQAEDIELDIDAAIPCGLIVNELVSNALKYAFPQGRTGELLIRFSQVAHDRYALSVTDNGVGLPQDLDVRQAKTLGLQLVNMLVTQLRGTLDVISDEGTTFLITFSTGGKTTQPEVGLSSS